MLSMAHELCCVLEMPHCILDLIVFAKMTGMFLFSCFIYSHDLELSPVKILPENSPGKDLCLCPVSDPRLCSGRVTPC